MVEDMILVRFETNEDHRPVKWPVKHPFWLSAETNNSFIIISYADNEEYIFENWPDAKILSKEESKEYIFTERFPKPKWLIKDNSLVSIIIPCYNKADTIERAVKSCVNQTYQDIEIIIVDDGSTDGSQEFITNLLGELKKNNIHWLFQENQGVANARNNGILVSSGEFICCLDADDWIEPTFIEKCVEGLKSDNAMGITYTRLKTHFPDGTSQISHWPGEFDADRQFSHKRRMNQIPTCCVFRREGFDRVGGYRQRYAPNGAGSEDAAFWTAVLATGYTAKLVTNEALFNYSALSGNVSGNRNYQEMDWLAWYPYTRTGDHPFLSPVKPEKLAHVVRDYSEPTISIIIPVGEGHIKYLQSCIDSVEAQEFWQWELILVDDTKDQALDNTWFMSAYPFAKILKTGGEKGAGVARNLGVSKAKGNFILFLDADDMLNVGYPTALDEMLQEFSRTGHAIYTGYINRAIVTNVDELDPKLRKNIVFRDEKDNDTWIRVSVPPYRCEDAIIQPKQDQAGKVYHWCNINTLIPRQWHIDIGGFDETMSTWEDLDYWWRIAKTGKCFTPIDKPFLIYRFSIGTRRSKAFEKDENGLPRWSNVLEYIKQKHSEIEDMGCNCGNKKQQTVKLPSALISSEQSELKMADDFVLIEFHFPGESRGSYGKKLNSFTGKRGPDGRVLEYGGYARKSGDKFLVHKDDQAARPDMFILVTETIPEVKQDEPKTPEPISEPEPPQPIVPEFNLDTLPLTTKQKTSLLEAGISSADEIKNLGISGLVELSGFGNVSAKRLLEEL